jgi:hypothetical protein
MSDYTDLIARLRWCEMPLQTESADALEVQARRIAELEESVIAPQEREIKRLCARIAELEAWLRARDAFIVDNDLWMKYVKEADSYAARAALEKKND